MNDIETFYQILKQEIESFQLANEEGANYEQSFTKFAIEYLCDAGETENYNVAYEERCLGTKKQLKINGYAMSENYETIDLFISLYKHIDNFYSTAKQDVDQAETRITNFFRACIYDDYANKIEESSEIFEFAHTLGSYEELRNNLIRVNVFILTNGQYRGNFPGTKVICGYKLFYRVIDIDYLCHISQNGIVPIEIDFKELGVTAPCLKLSDLDCPIYDAYLAVLSGECLYDLYEKYGFRLLENNVRSFLQFSGKINKGIRNTIMNEPGMFMAYNNGLSATADYIELDPSGRLIQKIGNLQIVNGGQTMASIYHSYRDIREIPRRPDLSKIFVQVKFSVINQSDKFSEIVSNISKFSNTQNKVNDADFSSNNPILIKLEQLSRSVLTPVTETLTIQTYWYFERVRGQYKTARRKEGFTKAKDKAFVLKNPIKQSFSKEDLAKFLNAYDEVYEGKKLVVGPFSVAKGGQYNFKLFINYNLPKEKDVNSILYEDIIAKTILFITADDLYGTKRSKNGAIGDLKNATVPYTIGLITHLLRQRKRELNLFKIWQNQCISKNLKSFLYTMMIQVNAKIIEVVSPSTNYTEMAKKVSVWTSVRDYDNWYCDFNSIEEDLIDPENPPRRKNLEITKDEYEDSLKVIKSVPWSLWNEIAEWGKDSEFLTLDQQTVALNIAYDIRFNHKIKPSVARSGVSIFEKVFEENYELLEKADDYIKKEEDRENETQSTSNNLGDIEITMDLVKQMVLWDKKHKKLADWKYISMDRVAKGETTLTPNLKKKFKLNLNQLMKLGFVPKDNNE